MIKDEEDHIHFNIWDDYYDDGYVPEGEIQSTYGYVEEYDDFPDEDKEELASLLIERLKTLDLAGVEVENGGEDVIFKHLTHERREKLIEELNQSEFAYKGKRIHFYSES